jgi:hypothetical protein
MLLNVIIGLLAVGITVIWFKKDKILRLRDQGTQTDLDRLLMNLLCDTTPLLSPMSEGSDLFQLSDLEENEESLNCDEYYFGEE